MNKALIGVVALTAWLANPMLACSGGGDGANEDEFAFGEAEMRSAVEGTYVGQLPATGESITLELHQAAATAGKSTTSQSTKRVQCGTRTFIQPAAACISMTEMPLRGIVSSDGTTVRSGDLTSGRFVIYGQLLGSGELSLTLADGATIRAARSASLGFHTWQLTTTDGQLHALELERGD